MKNLLTKYYNLDDETKEMLPFLYMYNELLASIDDYEDVEITSLADEEIIMNVIMKCWYSMNMDPLDIVHNLLSILDCQDISIKDLENQDIDSLKELMGYEEIIETEETGETTETTETSEIINDFKYKGYYCVLCSCRDKFLLILNNDDKSDVLIFDSMKNALSPIIDRHLIEKSLYEGSINK